MSEAIEFQVMPPLSMEEYNSLHDSIEQSGVQVPVVVDENGTVIDGHHRKKIATELGVECPTTTKAGLDGTAKRTLALSLNLDRRHLNREQRRELIAASVKADPQLTNREHAKRTGVSPTTVGVIRQDMEEVGRVSKLDTRTDSRGYQQPVTKLTETSKTETYFDAETGEVATGDITAPKEPAKPKRKPLTDAFFDAAYDLGRQAERIQRLADDDRFNTNKKQIALKHENDLLRVAETLARVLHKIQS